MNVNKKVMAIVSLMVITSAAYFSFKTSGPELINLKQAMREFERTHDVSMLEKHKKQIYNYYTTGAFERDVQNICTQALKHFSHLSVSATSLIIFDVDDTAFYNYQWRDDAEFMWKNQPKLIQARETKIAPAIKATLAFYNELKKLGFKTVFVSSRNQGVYDEYYKNLTQIGYRDFDKLILMPDALAFDRNIKTADWKLEVRKQLAQEYTIVGSVGDRAADFQGGYAGYEVKIPNYIFE
jgi:predicted secreted acid phosphatase